MLEKRNVQFPNSIVTSSSSNTMKTVLGFTAVLLLLQVFETTAQTQCFKDGDGFFRCVNTNTPTMIKDGDGFLRTVGGSPGRQCFKDGDGFFRCI